MIFYSMTFMFNYLYSYDFICVVIYNMLQNHMNLDGFNKPTWLRSAWKKSTCVRHPFCGGFSPREVQVAKNKSSHALWVLRWWEFQDPIYGGTLVSSIFLAISGDIPLLFLKPLRWDMTTQSWLVPHRHCSITWCPH